MQIGTGNQGSDQMEDLVSRLVTPRSQKTQSKIVGKLSDFSVSREHEIANQKRVISLGSV